MLNCFFGLSEQLTDTQCVTRSLTLRQNIVQLLLNFYFCFLKVKFVNIFVRVVNELLRL